MFLLGIKQKRLKNGILHFTLTPSTHIKHTHSLCKWNFPELSLFQMFCPVYSSHPRPPCLDFSSENMVSGPILPTIMTPREKVRFWVNRYFLNTFFRCKVGVLIQYLVKSEDLYYVGYGILFFPGFPYQHIMDLLQPSLVKNKMHRTFQENGFL